MDKLQYLFICLSTCTSICMEMDLSHRNEWGLVHFNSFGLSSKWPPRFGDRRKVLTTSCTATPLGMPDEVLSICTLTWPHARYGLCAADDVHVLLYIFLSWHNAKWWLQNLSRIFFSFHSFAHCTNTSHHPSFSLISDTPIPFHKKESTS